MTKRKPCKLCEAGNPLRGDEHWIVTSVSSPKITIKRCTNLPRGDEPKGSDKAPAEA